MPEVRMKRGVVLMGDSPILFKMIDAAKAAYFPLEKDVVITSGFEGTHAHNSLHYKGLALDFRTRHLTDNQRVEVMDHLRARLGDDYDVVFEGDHFHVEFDPESE